MSIIVMIIGLVVCISWPTKVDLSAEYIDSIFEMLKTGLSLEYDWLAKYVDSICRKHKIGHLAIRCHR